MTRDQVDLTRLLAEVSRHYLGRGFDSHAIASLRSTIISNTKGHTFSLRDTMYNFESPIVGLLPDDFWKLTWSPHSKPSQAQLRDADAIFAFSCGYQLKDLKDCAPQNRLPGKNNTKLAEIAKLLKERHAKPLFAQFEIAAAPALSGVEKFESQKEDIGTREVIRQFIDIAESRKAKPKSVIVVAHGHHIERCVRLLDRYYQVKGLPHDEQPYYCYDEQECQPRAMSAPDYIVSDFVSMAAMARDVCS
jgi:hypothetical protein